MQEADAEINVVGVEFRGAVGGLEVEERFVKLGRAAMLVCYKTQCFAEIVGTLKRNKDQRSLQTAFKLHRIYANHSSCDIDEACNLSYS